MLPKYDMATLAARLLAHPSPADASAERQAAVAAVLREGEGGEAELLLMRRAERDDDPWSGHMALPGGRRDPEDASLLDTARRETLEEVGIDLARHGSLLARLPDITARAHGRQLGLVVSAFVFALHEPVDLAPNHEVAEALWTPLAPLARGETAKPYPYQFGEQLLQLPSLLVGERVVWGLTYQMLQALFGALHG